MDSPFIVPVVLFTAIAAVLIFRGPLGKALAERIAGRAASPEPQLQGELDELRHRVAELEERLDFTERVLAREREAGRLGSGGERP